MERAQHRRAIVITTQITPTINLRPSLIHPLQKHTACNGEHQIPEQSREALVLRIDVVEGAGAQWRSRGGAIGIEVQQLREPGGGGVMEEEGGEVGDDVGGCGDVGLCEGEERAFVFLVADYEWDGCVFAVFDEDIGGGDEGCAVGAGVVGESYGLVGEDVGKGVY